MSRQIWFMADIHVAHTNVISLSKRPFVNVQEMEAVIVANINRVVKPGDVLYLLGDVSLGRRETWVKFLSSLTCKNVVLVIGNHDKWQCIPKDMLLGVFDQVTLRSHGLRFLLSHYPYRCSRWRAFWKRLAPAVCSKKRPRDSGLWLLHGHTHQTTRFVDYHPRMFNVGVDANNFKPVSIDEVISEIQRRASQNVDKKRT